MPGNLIIVSNRLPVMVNGEDITKSSGGLVTAMEGMTIDQGRLQWIGWPGGEIPAERQPEFRKRLEEEFGYIPVFVTADQGRGYYEGFSNSSLWPLLHYMPSRLRYEPGWWLAYQEVNRLFADEVLKIARPGDMVWVHDYQLMLLPAMLREAMPGIRIGFFLHTPFPSYEIIRCHPRRNEVVAGLLGADIIGFHTFGYLRHFRSAVLRLLGLESDLTRIRQETHTSTMGVFPIGINAEKFEQEQHTPEFAKALEALSGNWKDQKLVVSVERLDYTKGILHRLDAIEMFLDRRGAAHTTKFMFVAVPSRENIDEYRQLREEVEARVGRLNGKYASLHRSPIHFVHGSVAFPELCALYSVADVALVTPLIDGMNLVAKEYVAAQTGDPGVLVLSEFAGAAQELFNALIVNPYDTEAMAEALIQALDMPLEERRRRMAPMRERVLKSNAARWAKSFINELARPDLPTVEPENGRELLHQLRAVIVTGAPVALFLDYDGTLREIEQDPAAARPSAAVSQVLVKLLERTNVSVTIISGRSQADLQMFLGGYPFGLIAEHGTSMRRPHSKEWEQVDRNTDYSWKPQLANVLRLYEDSTPGSFVEEKRTSLVWHYRKADPEFGASKANQLVSELGVLTSNDPVHIRHGKKIVEITATEINKGAAIVRLLEATPYQLALCAGDDQTDETMFRLEMPHLLSVKIGPGETRARFRVPSPAVFRRLLMDAVAAK